MMKIVAVINYKGGVGKTTITSNLAGRLAYLGMKVLVLDMDAQSSLTFSFIPPDYWETRLKDTKTIKNWFDGLCLGLVPAPLSSLIIKPPIVNKRIEQLKRKGVIALIPSHSGLINVDMELATLLSGASMMQTKKKHLVVHGSLRKELKELSDEDYDIILIDCPPNFNIVTKNALVASDLILVPTKPDYLSTLGIQYLKKSVADIVKSYNEFTEGLDNETSINPQILGVVFTMIQTYNEVPIHVQTQFIEQTKQSGIPVFNKYIIANNSIFAEAPQKGIPVVLNTYPIGSAFTKSANSLKQFVSEFISKTGLQIDS
ncbi:ParA family protein [Breznakiellaceae bacterium SP9]